MKKNIVLIGMPGCGKTTIGKIIAKETGLKFYDVDEYIEITTNESILSLFKKGEEYFRNIETEAVKQISKKENIIISTGGGVIKREENIRYLKENGKIFFIDRPLNNILKDIDIEARPLLKDQKANLIKLYNERYKLYKKYSHFTVTNEEKLSLVVDAIMSNL
ncbi:shikimate kinase [Clostridium sp. Marseille-Q2269]|uniref:shikimate kinase n=1 Tax=Clostridium sp. Marseille-Q2269 TaxID=2942205 RepID=UPI002073499A|nr:shikimate kinase [Clostridium sp. Marseille-Q2269]